MRELAVFVCLCSLAIVVCPSPGCTAEPPGSVRIASADPGPISPGEFAAQAIRERMKIYQGKVIFEASTHIGPANQIAEKTIFTIVFRGDKLRVNRETVSGSSPGNRKLIFAPPHVAFHSDDPGPNGERAALVVGDESQMTNQISTYRYDPRTLGMLICPVQIQVGHRLDDLLQPRNAESLSVAPIAGPSHSGCEISYRLPNSAVVTAVVVPELGYTIQRARLVMKNLRQGIGELVDSLEVISQPHPVFTEGGANDVVWFPSSTEFKREIPGGSSISERVVVQSADFVTPVGDEQFKLDQLNLPPGVDLLERPAASGIAKELGLNNVPGFQQTKAPPFTTSAGSGRLFAIIAINLAAIACFLLWRVLRSRHAGRDVRRP